MDATIKEEKIEIKSLRFPIPNFKPQATKINPKMKMLRASPNSPSFSLITEINRRTCKGIFIKIIKLIRCISYKKCPIEISINSQSTIPKLFLLGFAIHYHPLGHHCVRKCNPRILKIVYLLRKELVSILSFSFHVVETT